MGGRPVMEYSIERIRAAGSDDIRVVTTPDRSDVIQHARELGCEVVEAFPRSAAASVATGIKGLAAGDVILCGFPDTLWKPGDGFRHLVRRLRSPIQIVLGVFTGIEPSRSVVVRWGLGSLI